MKKIILFAVAVMCFNGTKAQDTKQVFTSDEIVWYGLDFTKAKFTGQFDQGFGASPAKGYDMKTRWIPEWNDLVAKEQKNFDLKRSFRKQSVYYDPAPVNTANSKIDPDALMSFNENKIEKNTIDEMVKNYAPGDKKEGLGLVFVVENFNKNTETGTVYVTFFDIATKKVLLCEKESGKAIGVGLRNYWAGAVKNILKTIDNSEYKRWKQ